MYPSPATNATIPGDVTYVTENNRPAPTYPVKALQGGAWGLLVGGLGVLAYIVVDNVRYWRREFKV